MMEVIVIEVYPCEIVCRVSKIVYRFTCKVYTQQPKLVLQVTCDENDLSVILSRGFEFPGYPKVYIYIQEGKYSLIILQLEQKSIKIQSYKPYVNAKQQTVGQMKESGNTRRSYREKLYKYGGF